MTWQSLIWLTTISSQSIVLKKQRKSHGKYNDQTVPMREKLLALKLIIQSDETRFRLLSEGPGLLAVKSLEDRLNRIERMGEQRQISR